MGPPPKYLIQRKLIKNYVKKILYKTQNNPIEKYQTQMIQCFGNYGMGSEKCHQSIMKFDFAKRQQKQYISSMKNINHLKLINQTLPKPNYHFLTKGRESKNRPCVPPQLQRVFKSGPFKQYPII